MKHSAFLVMKLILSEPFAALSLAVFSEAQVREGALPSKTSILATGSERCKTWQLFRAPKLIYVKAVENQGNTQPLAG